MRRKVIFPSLRFVFLLAASYLILNISTATASEVSWPKARFQYVALKKDLRELLREFSKNQDITLNIADGVEGSVSGSFDLPPQALLDLLAANHHFSWHYDGTMLYITPSKEASDNGIKLRSDKGDQLYTRLQEVTKPDVRYSRTAETDTSLVTPLVATPAPGNDAKAGQNVGEEARDWSIESTDKTVNSTLSRWAAAAGWQLLWELPVDYSIDAKTTIHGTFTQAVEAVAKSMGKTEYPMKVIFYSGNKVLRIVAREAQ